MCRCVPFFAGMGVKGLQGFLDRCCPQACVPVDLKEMAGRHVSQRTSSSHNGLKFHTESDIQRLIVSQLIGWN